MDDDRDALRALLRDASGQPVRWPWPDRPPRDAAARRLLEALGVEGVPPVNAAATVCRSSLCYRPVMTGSEFCRAHAPVHELRGQRGADGGLGALERMDAGEPQTPDTEPDISASAAAAAVEPAAAGPEPRTGHGVARWTRATAIQAVTGWAEKHGRPPQQKESSGDATLPSASSVRGFGMTWADLIETAGFPRPHRGGPGQAVLAEREPKAGEAALLTRPSPEPEREAGTSAGSVSRPVSPASVGTDEPASRSASTASTAVAEQEAVTIAALLDLIRLLDANDGTGGDGSEYLDLVRWNAGHNGGGGETDVRLQATVRQLAVDRLGQFPDEEIGRAVREALS